MAEEDDFLMGGGTPSATFLEKGTTHEGTIIGKKMTQQRDFKTGKPKFFDNGDKMMQLVVTLQTDEFDDEIEDDDGRRNLYIKFKMRDAIKEAVKAADAKKLEEGGYLSVTYVSSEKPRRRGEQGAKLYEATYEPPTDTYLGDDDEGDDADEPDERPARRPAKKAPAKAAARGGRPAAKKAPAKAASRSRYVEDDDEGDDADEPGF